MKPGKPTQNSYVERLNRAYRTEVLHMGAFKRLSEVRAFIDNLIREYNEERPHNSLGD
ncbi:MAG: transposase [Nitrospina sp.]|nr:transposase [Nitrospina sp.]